MIFILEGEREFYEADGSIPDPEMIDKILEADCIVSIAEVTRAVFFCINHTHKSYWAAEQSVAPQMEDAGKFDYKIEFIGLFVLDEDFLLGEEKTISLPHTGEEVSNKHSPRVETQQNSSKYLTLY